MLGILFSLFGVTDFKPGSTEDSVSKRETGDGKGQLGGEESESTREKEYRQRVESRWESQRVRLNRASRTARLSHLRASDCSVCQLRSEKYKPQGDRPTSGGEARAFGNSSTKCEVALRGATIGQQQQRRASFAR